MKLLVYISLLVISLLISVILKLNYTELFMNTLYTILGIMFSIGLGLVVTFNLGGIRNRDFILGIRRNLKEIRSLYIISFVIATIFYLLESQLKSLKINRFNLYDNKDLHIQFDFSTFTVCVLLYSIIYCIANLLALQKLSEDIFDKTS
jgi:hypothetical protein